MEKLFSPITKAVFSVLSIFITGVLSSALVVEISKKGEVNWNDVTKTWSFKLILMYIIIHIGFNICATIHERNYRKQINDSFMKAFLKEKGIEILAKQAVDAVEKCDTSKFKKVSDIKIMLEGMINENNTGKQKNGRNH